MIRAILVHEPGGPDVLRWEEIEVGDPGPGEILLDQRAAGLNFIDVYHRTGLYPLPLPFVPGVEAAGVVAALGEGVEGFSVGDRVAYAGPVGGYCERRVIDSGRLVKIPDTIAFDQAAAMMLQGMTARMLLQAVYRVSEGDWILVHAAAGGVGLILCQWAKALGARVIGTVSTDDKAELARAYGCDHAIVYTRQDFVAEVERITGGAKVPVVYDSVGLETFQRSLDCLAPRGLMVSYGNASGPPGPVDPLLLSKKGSLFLTRPTLFHYIAERAELEASANELFEMVASGRVKIEIGQRYQLANAADAHRALESRGTSGSTVLVV